MNKLGGITPGTPTTLTPSKLRRHLDELAAQRNADPAFRAWEAEIRAGALPEARAAVLRKHFGCHIQRRRSDEDQALLALINAKLNQTF